MTLLVRLLAVFAIVLPAIAQQESQQASQPPSQSHPSPQLGVRYSAATDVSHISFNSPLVTYGSSLNEIQLPAAPIQPANLKQASQDTTSDTTSQEDHRQTLVRSFGNQQQAVQAEHQIQAAQHQSNLNQQQFISVQQYPARPRVQATPQGFSLRQDLPGPQPQADTRYASQFPTVQSQPPVLQQQQYVQPQLQQQQYVQPQVQYSTAQPQVQYASAPPQVQYASAPAQAQYPNTQPQQYVLPQQQAQYQNPLSYSSPTSNAYFATGPFATQYPTSNLVAGQYPAQLPVQYAQPVAHPEAIGQQYAAQQSAVPVGYSSAPAPLVSRVSFSGPTAGFSYGF